MRTFQQNIVSKRFLDILDELIQRGTVAHSAEFCKKIDFPPQSMSHIRTGRRDVTIELISKIFNSYNGNPIYLFSGQGEKVLTSEKLRDPKIGNLDAEMIRSLERLADVQDKLIKSYEREVNRLKEELKRR